jgi:hypothetical protein
MEVARKFDDQSSSALNLTDIVQLPKAREKLITIKQARRRTFILFH